MKLGDYNYRVLNDCSGDEKAEKPFVDASKKCSYGLVVTVNL